MNIQPQTTDKDRLIMTHEEAARAPAGPAQEVELSSGVPVMVPGSEPSRLDKAVKMYSGLWAELNAVNGLITAPT